MSNITKTFKHYKGLSYTLGVRSFGKYDAFVNSNESSLTIDRDTLTDYDGLSIETQPYSNGDKAVIDLSKTKLPWKYDFEDKLLTSRFAIMPYDETVTQSAYEKVYNGQIIGSVIDNNGVMSGFNSSNYFQYIFTIDDLTKPFEIYTRFITTNTRSNQIVMSNQTSGASPIRSDNLKLTSWSSSTNGGTFTLTSGVEYDVKGVSDGTTWYLYGKLSTDTEWTLSFSCDLSYMFRQGDNQLIFGRNTSSYTNQYLVGSIDFNYTAIYYNQLSVDSKTWKAYPVWNPKYIKNYTLNGSPTISKYQIASGFSSSNYINTGYTFNPGTSSWEWCVKFRKTEENSSVQFIMNGKTYKHAPYIVLLASPNTIRFAIGNGVSFIMEYDTITAELNTWYWAKIFYVVGEGIKFLLSTDGINYTQYGDTYTTPVTFTPNDVIYLGCIENNSYFHGEIDLTETYIKINDEIVWKGAEPIIETLQGCVKAYYGEGTNVTTPPQNASGEYQVFAVNGDERIALYSASYTKDGKIIKRLIQSNNVDENLWYLGNVNIDTGELKIELS